MKSELLLDFYASSQTIVLAGTLVAARITPIIQMVPLLGGAVLPQVAKMGLTLGLTVIMMPLLLTQGVSLESVPHGFEFFICLVKEALFGFIIAFLINAIFETLRIAGQFIDQARGQTQATLMLPTSKQQASVLGVALYQLGVGILFATGGHLLIVQGIIQTYKTLGPFDMPKLHNQEVLITFIIRAISDVILGGVLFAFPIITAILLADVVLGLINKAAPQINVFFLGMPLKAAIGIAVLIFSIGLISETFVGEFVAWMDRIYFFLEMVKE